jgi:hypothetical protein
VAKALPEPSQDDPPKAAVATELVRKLQAVVARAAEADRLVQRANVREALTRTDLTLALCEALTGRADALREARERALEAYRRAAAARSRPRRSRFDRLLDRLLVRLGWPGQMLVIARSGVWRGSGPDGRGRLGDLARIAGYARRGADPQAVPQALFDQAWHVAAYPDIAATRLSPLAHYLVFGGDQNRAPHPLFDAAYYRSRNAAALEAARLTPLEHFLRVGAAEGRDPHPLFSIAHYVADCPEARDGANPLEHYLAVGWSGGHSPHPLFDAAWVGKQAANPGEGRSPLVRYLVEGWAAGLTPHPLFDPLWYLERYPDVAAAGIEPLTHFVTAGAADRRDPSRWFDTIHYLAARGDGSFYDDNPLIDYLAGGAWRVSEARPGFPSMAYLISQPELVRQGVTPLEHWARLEEG